MYQNLSSVQAMVDFQSRIVTYSPAFTIVPTYECFNRCSYCNFRVDPNAGKLIELSTVQEILTRLQNQPVCEILILSGEVHPQSSRRQTWLQRIYDVGKLALQMGFLPHTNAGILSFAEMEKLKQVNASMGLMLEQVTPKLLQTVHKHAPSKVPSIRLQQLEWAGLLKIPFTTGLLLGIGENQADWIDSLQAIRDIHLRYQHIQEVILQPHSPGKQQTFTASPFHPHLLPDVVALAREILPSEITIQIPPNLVSDHQWLLACLEAGARDLGGISPKDEVNPDYVYHTTAKLQELLHAAGWILKPRLPVYSRIDESIPQELQPNIFKWVEQFEQWVHQNQKIDTSISVK